MGPSLAFSVIIRFFVVFDGMGRGLGHSSFRSAMFIAETVLARNKLRQERHGKERCQYRRGRRIEPQTCRS